MNGKSKYETELAAVFDKLFSMCRAVEAAIEKSGDALTTKDYALADEVIKGDTAIDNLEHEIEQDCLKILLMEHPVASDFRDVSAALKMITDLERIGDQAADICEIVFQFGQEQFVAEPHRIKEIATLAAVMVKDSVLSLLNGDLELARSLDKRDDRVDDLFREIKDDCVRLIQKDGKNADQAILFMMIAKYLERIADHAVNIGEWVEYALTGHHKIG